MKKAILKWSLVMMWDSIREIRLRGGENVSGDWKWNKKEGNGGVEQNLRR